MERIEKHPVCSIQGLMAALGVVLDELLKVGAELGQTFIAQQFWFILRVFFSKLYPGLGSTANGLQTLWFGNKLQGVRVTTNNLTLKVGQFRVPLAHDRREPVHPVAVFDIQYTLQI